MSILTLYNVPGIFFILLYVCMPILEHRKKLTTSARRLRRARRLYMFLCRHAWQKDPNTAMANMEKQCYDRGLYYQPPRRTNQTHRDWRYSICRHMFKIFHGPRESLFCWSKWLRSMNLDDSFVQTKPVKKTA